MTYIYYKSSSYTTEPKISEKQMAEWKHLATKKPGELHNYLTGTTKLR